MAPVARPLVRRLADKVVIDEGCWHWVGEVTGSGYGRIFVAYTAGRIVRKPAHRAFYELLVGPIPEGLELDHLCRNKVCVRPDHLEPVSHRENLRRSDLVTGKRTAKTHCPKGHAYDERNTQVYKGHRHCRECRRLATAARRARKKGA